MKDISLYENVPPLKNNFTVKIREYVESSLLIAHWHEHIELLYFLDGGCEMLVGGERFVAKAGDLAVVNSSEVHSFVAVGSARYLCVLIYPAFFSDVDIGGVRIKSHIKKDDFVGDIFSKMWREAGSDDVGADMMLKSHTYNLMAYLVRNFSVPRLTDEEYMKEARQLKRLASVMDMINNSYRDRISTRDLAAAAYMTESHFCRFFKSMTGVSAVRYINDLRIERAALLLIETQDPVSQIAAEVGFEDVNYFSRIFRSLRGMSPTEYRKKVKRV